MYSLNEFSLSCNSYLSLIDEIVKHKTYEDSEGIMIMHGNNNVKKLMSIRQADTKKGYCTNNRKLLFHTFLVIFRITKLYMFRDVITIDLPLCCLKYINHNLLATKF